MKKKILVVDDNQMMRDYMVDLLEKEGHEVTTAEDGITALDILKSIVPDIIFVDLIMPKIDGERLCRIIRSKPRLKGCHVVVLSGAVAEIGFDHAQIGANRCIVKGPMKMMADNVLKCVKDLDNSQQPLVCEDIMGLEGVMPRQMTKELLIRNRYLESILGSIAEGVIELYSGRVIYANAAAEYLFDMPQEEILNAIPSELFNENESNRIEDLLKRAIDGPAGIGSMDPIYLNKRLVSVKCFPIKEDATSQVMLISDITQRKQMELELQHAHKMEAIGTIASGIAHNFRNTLASILTNSQVLQLLAKSDEQLIEVVQRINSAVRKGTQLVDALLQFSRKQTKEESEIVDLCGLIDDIYTVINESFSKNVNISIVKPENLLIKGRASDLRHALMNLCTNAEAAMPDGGNLTIEAIAVGHTAAVKISDTGSGMTQETVNKCFDPFFTQGEIGEATGMGLSTTYGIVKTHNGEIQVETKLNQGSVFTLTFPRIIPDQESSEAGSNGQREIVQKTKEQADGNSRKILVVDNEKDLVNALIKLLEFLEYQAVAASNGLSAIETYKKYKPDIVLMDINMPGMDGITCAEKIKEFDSEAKIAIISGYEENYGIEESKKNLIAGYLTKPISLKELSTFLDKWS